MIPARWMEDGNGRMDAGRQLPAATDVPVEDGPDDLVPQEGQEVPVARQEEDGEMEQEQEVGEEEEEVNGFLNNMANALDQQGLQGPAIAADPGQQGRQENGQGREEDQQGDMFVVSGRERPVLPPPLPGPVADGDGWEAIYRIGAEAAFRVCCPMLQHAYRIG